jgi:hypothetical protein
MDRTFTGYKCVKQWNKYGEYPHYNACMGAIRNLTTNN